MHRLFNHEKHYLTLNNYLRDTYHQKGYRISLNAGLTCPNRDDTKSNIGCLYCSAKLSGDYSGDIKQTLKEQFFNVKSHIEQKWQNGFTIAYLQAGTNTYADITFLANLYEEIINLDESIKIISIATRPDCLSEDIVKLLANINTKKEVWVELGFQTSHEKTAKFINRCYTNDCFEKAMSLLKDYQLKVIVHIINGLPYETPEMMIDTAKYLSRFSLFGLKIHMLHLLKNTPLYDYYQKQPFPFLTLQEFVYITTTQLRYIDENVVIHRLTGDAPLDLLVVPKWTIKKFIVLNEIDKHMREKNIFQGDLCIKQPN